MEITRLEGKVAVVTGAGRMRSIGRPIAVELARAGCDIDAVADEVRRGVADRVPVVDLDVDVWHNVVDINLNGTFLMGGRSRSPIVAVGAGGSTVNISSIGGKMMVARTAAYAASKAPIYALTCAMASELGPDGVRVHAVCPGIIDTYRMDDAGRGERWDQMIVASVTLGRPGTCEDMANMDVYLQ